MQKLLSIFLIIGLCWVGVDLKAQIKTDSSVINAKKNTDSSNQKKTKVFDPRLATKRSAMVPGWGQIYNKKYWKLPLVYGGLGVTAGVFVYNVKNYRLLRQAFIYKTDTLSNDDQIDPRFRNLSAGALRSYRNSFRQNVDYSVLFFIIFWGLNVADATVDAHLKAFDVNDNLSLQIKQGYSPMANTTGISLVVDIHSKKMRAGK